MAIVTDNGNLITPKVKPGASLFFNRDGTITGKAGYTYRAASGVLSFSIGQAHPYDSNAFLAQYGITFDAAGLAEMDGDYVGVWSTTNYMVDGIAATQQEKIETNPVFISALAGTPGSPIAAHDPHWDDNDLFQGFGANATDDLAGVEAYLSGGFVVRITNASLSSGDVTAAINLLGLSSESVTAGIITYSYGFFAFLCTNVTYKEVPIGSSSATFTITVEYTFTPPNGWNQLIYQTPP